MAISGLNLPQDVPWERIATGAGMIDRVQAAGDGSVIFHSPTPNVWKPFLSIFSYLVPEEESQAYPGRRIVFLKIPITLTGIRPRIVRQAPQPGVDILDPVAGLGLEFEASTPYLPCYGALVHVAVYPMPVPKSQDWRKYPYIMDMEPKRREVFQATTESQQYLEGALDKVGFNKSSGSETTTGAGFNFGTSGVASGSNPIPLTGGYNHSTGVVANNASSTNIDWSREKRESLSYTSQINHIHQVQVAYHLGNNRVFLAIQPRPALDEREFLLVNGPRKLEGIQDFVLVVNAPADLDGFCVYAKVESAHIYEYYEDTPPDKGTLLVVSNEASTCMPFKPPKDKPWKPVSLEPRRLPQYREKDPHDRGLQLTDDLQVELEKTVKPIPRPKARTSGAARMALYNHYIEECVLRPLVNSVDSLERYAAPVHFARTRVAQIALTRILARLSPDDSRNLRLADIPTLDARIQERLRIAQIKSLRDLLVEGKGKRKTPAAKMEDLVRLRQEVLTLLF